MALDIGCLEELEKQGFLVCAKKQPDNRQYAIFGRELGIDMDKTYQCGHFADAEKYEFVSFGAMPDISKNSDLRVCFPDIIKNTRLLLSDLDKDIFDIYSKIIYVSYKDLFLKCGKIMETITSGDRLSKTEESGFLLELLENLGYIKKADGIYTPIVPTLFLENREGDAINKIINIVTSISVEFIKKNHKEIMYSISATTPVLNNISKDEVFNQVWHEIFGYCNIFLAEKGFIYNPRKDGSEYLPFLLLAKNKLM